MFGDDSRKVLYKAVENCGKVFVDIIIPYDVDQALICTASGAIVEALMNDQAKANGWNIMDADQFIINSEYGDYNIDHADIHDGEYDYESYSEEVGSDYLDKYIDESEANNFPKTAGNGFVSWLKKKGYIC